MSAPAPNGANTAAPPAANDARDPSGFLSEIIGAPVTVKLNSGVVYKGMHSPIFPEGERKIFFVSLRSTTHDILTRSSGELQSVDGYMNIALEGTREFVDGKMRRSYGDAFVRGNNGASILSLPIFTHYGSPVCVASRDWWVFRKVANSLSGHSHIHLCRLIGLIKSLRTRRTTNY